LFPKLAVRPAFDKVFRGNHRHDINPYRDNRTNEPLLYRKMGIFAGQMDSQMAGIMSGQKAGTLSTFCLAFHGMIRSYHHLYIAARSLTSSNLALFATMRRSRRQHPPLAAVVPPPATFFYSCRRRHCRRLSRFGLVSYACPDLHPIRHSGQLTHAYCHVFH
jgi:hypothetical protein